MTAALIVLATGAALASPGLAWIALRIAWRSDAALTGAVPVLTPIAIAVGVSTATAIALTASMPPFSATALAVVLGATAITDLAAWIIPDVLTGGLLLAGLCSAADQQGYAAALCGALTAAALLGALLLVRAQCLRRWGDGALGLGDVKLLGAMAVWFEPMDLAAIVLVASALMIASHFALRRKGYPFAAFLAPAAALAPSIRSFL